MECPHCGAGYTDTPSCYGVENPPLQKARILQGGREAALWGTEVQPDERGDEYEADEGARTIIWQHCPECRKTIVELSREPATGPRIQGQTAPPPEQRWLVYPKRPYREPLPESVPREYQQDLEEAWIALTESPKASAALSRRCLQRLIREKAGIRKRSLYLEVEALLESGSLPGYVEGTVDGLRIYGNFSAHPMESESTGEIIDVEPGEAESTIETLRDLIDHYFVKPALAIERREKANRKLADAGKPPMLQPRPEESDR